MHRGGISNKLGNLYELKWAVCKLLEVIDGRVKSIQYEGISEKFLGFEFSLNRNHSSEWHQTKINAPKGNWTLNRLKRDGVMDAFKARLSTDATAKCVFVSQDSSKQMRELCKNAKMANNLSEFVTELSQYDDETFTNLIATWNADQNTAYEWLQHCEFRTESQESFDEFIELYSSNLLVSNTGVFESLSNYLLENLNKVITTDSVRKWVSDCSPFDLQPSLDPTLQQKVEYANQQYLASYQPFGFGGNQVKRAESRSVIDEILSENRMSLILLTGVAGSGKSGIVREVVTELKKRNKFHLALRIDRYLSCTTRKEIGKKLLDFEVSPVRALQSLSKNETSILIIDQIDAVSESSGRTGAIKEVLFELVRELECYDNVGCLLVCRSSDLEYDSQYRTLKQKAKVKHVQVSQLSWENDVEPILKKAGVAIDDLDQSQRQLLTLPINLSVFLEIDEPTLSFTTLTTLLNKLLEKKTRDLKRDRNVTWNTMYPLREMADWMSKRQQLSCPDFVLDKYDQSKEWLSSENLIVVEQNRLAFFHECFFDFIFARTFAESNENIIDFLNSTEQHLFRRTQVRQILNLMRDTDRFSYLSALESVLTSPKIRFHIKLAVAQWMATLENVSTEELRVIQILNDNGSEFPILLRTAIFESDNWFDLLNDSGDLLKMLKTIAKPRRRQLLLWLSRIVSERPKPVARLLQNWWGCNTARHDEVIQWFDFFYHIPVDQAVTALLCDAIRFSPRKFFSRIDQNKIVSHMLRLCVVNAKASADILQLLFVHWFEQSPNNHLFTHAPTSEIDISDLAQLAEKSPTVFLNGMTPSLVKSVEIEGRNSCSGSSLFVLYDSRGVSGPNKLFSFFRDALQTLAKTSPKETEAHLNHLDLKLDKALLHLHLETIKANPTALGHRFAALLNEQHVFSAGLRGAEWLSFAETARAVIEARCLSVHIVEKQVLSFQPEIKLAQNKVHDPKITGDLNSLKIRQNIQPLLSQSGHVEWCVLKTIGHNLLSTRGKKRLAELERKFPDSVVPSPNIYEAKWNDSPIRKDAIRMMTDKQWISAINKYDSESSFNDMRVVGGASELAQDLGELARSDPNRFTQFFLRLPDTVNSVYGQFLIQGLTHAEKLDRNTMISVLCKAHEHPNKPFGLQIVRFLEKHSTYARESNVFKVVLWYAEHGEAIKTLITSEREHLEPFPSINDLIGANRSLINSGINSTRGVAWMALGRLIQGSPQQSEEIWTLLERQTYKETCLSVRVMMLSTLSELSHLDLSRFRKCLQILTKAGVNKRDNYSALAPLATDYGVRLFPFIEHHFPNLALELMERMINSTDSRLSLIGAWWTLAERLRQGKTSNRIPNIQHRSPAHSKLWASILCEFSENTEFRNLVISELKTIFSHEVSEVRKEAGNVFSYISSDEFPHFIDLARSFIHSPAFKDSTFPIISILKNTTCNVTEFVIEAIGIIVYKWENYGLISALNIEDIIKREYVNSEGQPEFRKKILDLIDHMAKTSVIGVEDILSMRDR